MTVEPGPSASRLSREEIAKSEVGRTDVSPATARSLAAVFLLLIGAPAVVDLIASARRTEGDRKSVV